MQNFLILFSSSSVGSQSHGVCSMATSASSVSGLAGTRLWSSGCGHRGKVCEQSNKLRVGSLNVGTLKNTAEVIETVSWRRINLCCLQETRWRGGLLKTQSRMFTGKNSCYKFFYANNKEGNDGVGIVLAQCWVANVFDMVLILLKLAIQKDIRFYIIMSWPSGWLQWPWKGKLLWQVLSNVAKIPTSEILVL